MPFVILMILVFGSALVAWYMPHLRAIALGVLVFFGALTGYLFLVNGSETERQAQLVPASEITLTELDFSTEPRPARLTGNMLNGSETYTLRNVSFRVTLHNCPSEDTDFAECVTIADSTASTNVNIPAGQQRSFNLLLQFPNMPEIDGFLRWHHEVIATRATG